MNLLCQQPGCLFYAAGNYKGMKLCGTHLPPMPIECPTCNGSGEYLPTGQYSGNPHDPGTVPCPTCAGNGALTAEQYRDQFMHLITETANRYEETH